MSSTAKSMATSYLNAKRNANNKYQQASRFKSSQSNLSTLGKPSNDRLKSTSMTNLIAGEQLEAPRSIQRPASRNALDSIHNGMNAKYAQIQSKVLLQNIRPPAQASHSKQQKSNTLQPAARSGRLTPTGSSVAVKVPSDRTQLLMKLKTLQEEFDKLVEDRESSKLELEREKSDKSEQISQLKQELQEKLLEHDKQHEEYHQKLLEAYELADQNRRAADQVLSESRARDEELRKKNEELEQQLLELKEFVSMKEEMTSKMYELREQIREERERYEEQLKSLHQVFENEKLRQGKAQQKCAGLGYFKRTKPSLQSNESINNTSQCRHCQSGSSQLHNRSEHDLYGSKLSTRMQDTAKSAWKASKHFASSVITGGVGISGCRKRTVNQTRGSKSTATNEQVDACRPAEFERVQIRTNQQQQDTEEEKNNNDDDLTSVIKVESQSGNVNVVSSEQQATVHQQQQQHVIRVDENNKLTIVTKFNDLATDTNGHENSHVSIQQAQPQQPSATGSERSRCESSSSGRGTSSSDAGSTAPSQNGDEPPSPDASSPVPAIGNQAPSQVANLVNGGKTAGDSSNNNLNLNLNLNGPTDDPMKHKQHRRKSSLFKANKVFGSGSQVSLNKLKTFLFTSNNGKATISGGITDGNNNSSNAQPGEPVDARQAAEQHLESSRLRCMELNRAIKLAAPAAEHHYGKAAGAAAENGLRDVEPASSPETNCTEEDKKVGQGGLGGENFNSFGEQSLRNQQAGAF